jgi:hypothetical protein
LGVCLCMLEREVVIIVLEKSRMIVIFVIGFYFIIVNIL